MCYHKLRFFNILERVISYVATTAPNMSFRQYCPILNMRQQVGHHLYDTQFSPQMREKEWPPNKSLKANTCTSPTRRRCSSHNIHNYVR